MTLPDPIHLKAEAWERAGTALLAAPFGIPPAKLGHLYADLRKAEDELTAAVRHARQDCEDAAQAAERGG